MDQPYVSFDEAMEDLKKRQELAVRNQIAPSIVSDLKFIKKVLHLGMRIERERALKAIKGTETPLDAA